MMLQSKNLGCRLWLIPNKVVKDLRRLLVVIFQLMLFICLSGCGRNSIEFQEVIETESYEVSDQEDGDNQEVMETEVNTVSDKEEGDDQEVFEKGYNLPILAHLIQKLLI